MNVPPQIMFQIENIGDLIHEIDHTPLIIAPMGMFEIDPYLLPQVNGFHN